jgi:hypothetical protein
LDLSGCAALTTSGLNYSDNELESLNLSGCESLESLPDPGETLTALNVSGCAALTSLAYADGDLTELDASGCASLTTLNCKNNSLKSLNLSGCAALTASGLNYSGNELESLNLSGCASLTTLPSPGNNLTTLDVSGCESLTYLSYSIRNLTTLDVVGCSALTHLYCYINKLETLDLTGCTSLEYVYCGSNQLTELDVSHCANLIYLDCGSNNLKTLKLPDSAPLKTLYCANNELTTLDVSGCKLLTSLDCGFNQLSELNVSENTALEDLDARMNPLTGLNITGLDDLKSLGFGNVEGLLEAVESFDDEILFFEALEYRDGAWHSGNHAIYPRYTTITGLESYAETLEELYFFGNANLDDITFSNLERMIVIFSDITTVDFDLYPNLTYLELHGTTISSLDLSGTNIESLYSMVSMLTYLDLSDYSATDINAMVMYQVVPVTLTNDGNGTYSASIRIGELTDDPPDGAVYTPDEDGTEGTLMVTDTSIKELKFSTSTGLQDTETPPLVTGKLLFTYEGENNPPDVGNNPSDDNANTDADNNTSDDDEKPRPSAPSSGSGSSGGGSTAPSPSPSPSVSPEAPKTGVDSELANPYSDVFESDWFYSDVLAVTFAGLMKGKDTTYTYCPSDDLTRAEWVMILARLSNAPAANAVTEPWYQAVWDWGIAEGITDGTNPTFPITREQLVTILWRLNGSPASNADALNAFTDASSVSDWARGAVAWAVGRGILQGDANGLRPGDDVKRSEVAAILRRYTAA